MKVEMSEECSKTPKIKKKWKFCQRMSLDSPSFSGRRLILFFQGRKGNVGLQKSKADKTAGYRFFFQSAN